MAGGPGNYGSTFAAAYEAASIAGTLTNEGFPVRGTESSIAVSG